MPEGTLLLFHVNYIYIGQGKPAHYLLLRLQTLQVYIKFMSLSWSYKSLFISSIQDLPVSAIRAIFTMDMLHVHVGFPILTGNLVGILNTRTKKKV
jgi:hypothetical protein